MTRVLDIWWDGRLVGQLTQNQHGELGFAYAPDWLNDDDAPPLSNSLPKRVEPFTRRECRPFFGGLLPEESQRDAAARALGVSPGNDFALLCRLGGDVAGAQSKVPVVLVDGAVALPAPGQPTTHILKPPISRFSATTENEAFVMRLAAAVGLDVAPVEARVVRDRTFLLVQRYDRAGGEDGRVRRIHQEDFCQALGVPPETKYTSEGGPALPFSAASRPGLRSMY